MSMSRTYQGRGPPAGPARVRNRIAKKPPASIPTRAAFCARHTLRTRGSHVFSVAQARAYVKGVVTRLAQPAQGHAGPLPLSSAFATATPMLSERTLDVALSAGATTGLLRL